MKASLKTTAIIAFLVVTGQASAMGLGQVKENYTNEATASIEYSGYQSSDYYVECIPSGDGEVAICNALSHSSLGRTSLSLFCERTYYGENGSFTGITCIIRAQANSDFGSSAIHRY